MEVDRVEGRELNRFVELQQDRKEGLKLHGGKSDLQLSIGKVVD